MWLCGWELADVCEVLGSILNTEKQNKSKRKQQRLARALRGVTEDKMRTAQCALVTTVFTLSLEGIFQASDGILNRILFPSRMCFL